MYSTSDLDLVKKQIKKSYGFLSIPVFLLLSLCIFGMVMHLQRNDTYHWLSYLSLLTAGLLALFFSGLFILPLHAYQRHLKDMLFGRNHELIGRFKCIDEEVCIKDGVAFRHVTVSEGNDICNEENDRSFYFDLKKDFPNIETGDEVSVKSHDRRIIYIKK